MNKRRWMLALPALSAGVSIGVPALAQPAARPFVLENTQILPLQSKLTGKAHELVVVLPPGYADNPNKTYPVLYFLDAYWDAAAGVHLRQPGLRQPGAGVHHGRPVVSERRQLRR